MRLVKGADRCDMRSALTVRVVLPRLLRNAYEEKQI